VGVGTPFFLSGTFTFVMEGLKMCYVKLCYLFMKPDAYRKYVGSQTRYKYAIQGKTCSQGWKIPTTSEGI
jgi:hypothetical protein